MSNEDEALNRAILASIQDNMDLRKGLETKRPDTVAPPVVTPTVVEPEVVPDPRPPNPPANPPKPGMTMHTFIKNGWITREWR